MNANAPLILIIDENIEFRIVLGKMLEKEGYQVFQCTSIKESMALIAENQFSLILVDIVLNYLESCPLSCRISGKFNAMPLFSPIAFLVDPKDQSSILFSSSTSNPVEVVLKNNQWFFLTNKIKSIIENHEALIAFHQNKISQSQAQDAAKLSFLEWNPKLDYILFADNFSILFGVDKTIRAGGIKAYQSLMAPKDKRLFIKELNSVVRGEKKASKFEHKLKNKIVQTIVSRKKNGSIFIVVQDISDFNEAKALLSFQKNYDPLTGLANRHYLIAEVKRYCLNSQRFAIINFDINRFKMINDSIGHDESDQILKIIAQRIKKYNSHHCLVSRVSTDDFFMLIQLKEEQGKPYLKALASELNALLAKPFALKNTTLYIETSMGIALYPKDGEDAAKIINSSTLARLEAKQSGGGHFLFYNNIRKVDSATRLKLESELRYAFIKKEFKLFYQPQICIQTGRVIGVEALIRWTHSELGEVSPAHFIPIAEDLDLIHQLGEWIINTAVKQAKQWENEGLNLRVGINVSAKQFLKNKLDEIISMAIKKNNVSPELIDIEITESVAMKNPDMTLDTLNKIKKTGASIAIDDFGTGYSSLEYLQKFPIDYIKIDRAFIKNIVNNQSSQTIVKAIISISKSMGMRVIVEGVEEQNEYDLIKSLGAHEVQGFFISKALNPILIKDFVNRQKEKGAA